MCGGRERARIVDTVWGFDCCVHGERERGTYCTNEFEGLTVASAWSEGGEKLWSPDWLVCAQGEREGQKLW